jgi:hypothetical protein
MRISFLFPLVFLAFSRHNLEAAVQRDTEIELTETIYHVNPGNTAEVTVHQRWRALTAKGREAVSQVSVPL